MSNDNKILNERWIEAFNDRRWGDEAACRAVGFVAHMSGAPGPLDNAGWAEFMGGFTGAFPDARISIESTVAEDDLVACRWTIAGTHRGEFQGAAPTGRPIRFDGIDLSRVVDGKIAEHWAQFDLVGLMNQIQA